MNLLHRVRNAVGALIAQENKVAPKFDFSVRAMPGQALEAQMNRYASSPDVARYMAQYALNAWVYTAVARLAEAAAVGELEIVHRDDMTKLDEEHPILDLLGPRGKPNDDQDVLEFWELHHTLYELCGNVYWFWYSRYGGEPEQVYILPPSRVRVVPGRDRMVAGYEYQVMGKFYPLSVDDVTHFRRPNPFNYYYGLPALEAIMIECVTDRSMATWNRDFFGDGVAIPAGILVISPDTSDQERDRLDREVNAEHGSGRRKTAILRADAGATVFHSGGLGPHEMDFGGGRKLNRQAVYEALGLPTGLMSETSTEAHARVAERRYMNSVYQRLIRVASKLQSDALGFWPAAKLRTVRFRDVRVDAADWDQMQKKITTLLKIMPADMVAQREFGIKLPKMEAGNVGVDGANGASASAGQQEPESGGDNRPLPREG